ncbi:MAG: hypothetical protein L0211_26710 [Planctomycetaceae bacterium]|nr:hypothetical protein [Planctomycetaceae bacterium]
MIGSREFPRLTATNYRITSPATSDYNCIAWAASDTEHWWQPGVYWPISASIDDFGVNVLESALGVLGFEPCGDGQSEVGFVKVAIYGSSLFYTHAARELPSGKWTSKLGRDVDIEHDTPSDVAGGLYGEVVRFMKRAANQG